MPLTVNVTILSAGSSPYLAKVIQRILDGGRHPDRLDLIWSGVSSPPADLPDPVRVLRIPPETFDHGATRQMALERCREGLQVFLSDDAEPATERWLELMCTPFDDDQIVAVFGRQIARPSARIFEAVYRQAKYPAEDQHLGVADLERIAAGLAPVSNANSAYRTSALLKIGGFPRRARFAEDVAVAIRVIEAGGVVRYVARAPVLHSHDHSLRQVLGRGWHAAGTWPLARSVGFGRATRRRALAFVLGLFREGWRQYRIRGMLAVSLGVGARVAAYAMARVASWGRASVP
jgi:rhamnosyltransferase